MEEKSIILNSKKAKYYTLTNSNSNQTAHFYGGNGFALKAYEPLLTALSQKLNLTALTMRGEWYDKPSVSKSTARKLTREQDADILIDFLQKTQAQRDGKPVIGIGHSQGTTATTLAVAQRPELFSHLFLLEPVTFTKRQKILYDLAPRSLKLTQEPFKSTLAKQAIWGDVADYYQYLRHHRAFKRMSDEHLQIYANNSLQVTADGKFELVFSPQQELANYFGTPFINEALQTIEREQKVPYTIVMGKPSMFISEDVRASWRAFIPEKNLVLLSEYGHLLPMESPEKCAEVIFKKLIFDKLKQ